MLYLLIFYLLFRKRVITTVITMHFWDNKHQWPLRGEITLTFRRKRLLVVDTPALITRSVFFKQKAHVHDHLMVWKHKSPAHICFPLFIFTKVRSSNQLLPQHLTEKPILFPKVAPERLFFLCNLHELKWQVAMTANQVLQPPASPSCLSYRVFIALCYFREFCGMPRLCRIR